MEHRALALAYRPQVFADVAGQRHVTDVLEKAVEHGRVAHAYLFSGPRGTGKTTTARILAKVLNCPNRKGAIPCNKCDVCRDITSGVSLDVVEIDGASNRGIADIQQLRESVRFAATGGRYKVYIIDEVHQLSSDAFAALLKTLEEPPPHVAFIFATTDPLKLPDTIRSRTQRYEFARVPVRTIAERLHEIARLETKAGRKLDLDDAAAFLIARKAEGGLRDAVSALDQVVSTGRAKVDEKAVTEVLGLVSRETFFELAGPVLGRDPAKALAEVHRAYRAGFDVKDLAEGLLEHLRNVLVLQVDDKAGELIAATPEECERYRKQGEGWSQEDLLRFLRITADAIVVMRDSSQPLLHFETAVLEMAGLEPGRTLASILARLEAIEGTGTGPSAGPAPGSGSGNKTGGTRPTIPAIEAVRPVRPRATAPPAVEGFGAPGPAAFDLPGHWQRVVSTLLEKKRILGHFLEEARVVGWQGEVLVLEIEAGHRGLLDHKDNRVLVLAALNEVYGRALDYRCVQPSASAAASVASAAAQRESVPPPDEDIPLPEEPAYVQGEAAAQEEPPEVAPPMLRSATPVRHVHPDDLSPAARRTMLWLEGEIVGQERPI